MSDYGKKKNDELAALCKERGLAHTGKKADLVKRLEEHDASSAAAPANGTANEDEIDWDEEPATETKGQATEVSGDATAAVNADESMNAELTTQQQSAPAADTAAPAAEASEKKEEPNFSTGLATRNLDEEIEKRKARARRFGMPEDSEEIKALERAKKFGSDEPSGLGLLNGALPEKRERKQRGGESSGQSDGGIRKKGRDRGPRGKVQGAGASEKAKPAAKGDGRFPGWMTEKDREAAERRKARFSAAT